MVVQKEWLEKDYYQILGVEQEADQKTITKSYRNLARQFHPDTNPGDSSAEENFKEVAAAYDVLNDSVKRREYDEVRSNGFGTFGGSFGDSVNLEDLGTLLGDLFGGSGGGGVARGADLRVEVVLQFFEALSGTMIDIQVPLENFCVACSGSGAAPGSMPVVCDVCGGRGVQQNNQGVFSFASKCGRCRGSGQIVTHGCSVCQGRGVTRDTHHVKLKIPAGVDNGQTIRVTGRGAAGMNGGPAGDLFVEISVIAHPLFERNGLDVTVEVPVEMFEAALGAKIEVPTVYGSKVKIVVPPGSDSGRILRVAGQGISLEKAQGDMFVRLMIDVPNTLNPLQKQALKDLETATRRSIRGYLFEELS